MTLNDFLKRIDIEKDKNKMLIHSDGIGWTNLEIEVNETEIRLLPCKNNSPFQVISSGNLSKKEVK